MNNKNIEIFLSFLLLFIPQIIMTQDISNITNYTNSNITNTNITNSNTTNNDTIYNFDLEVFGILFGLFSVLIIIIGVVSYIERHRIQNFMISKFGISVKNYTVQKIKEEKKEKALKLCETFEYSTNPNIKIEDEKPKIVQMNNTQILKKTYAKKKIFI